MARWLWLSRSRVFAASVFAAAGLVLAAGWYGPVVVHSRFVSIWVLFLGLPSLSGATAGAVGAPLLDPARCRGGGAAALRGAGLALAAFVLFALLFGAGMTWADQGSGWTNPLGLSLLVLSIGFLMAGPWVAGLGAVAGWVVWRVLRPRVAF